MFQRVVAALFALTLLSGSGRGPTIENWCAMVGKVTAQCCCHKPSAKPAREAGIERDMRCCHVQLSDTSKPTVTVRGDERSDPQLTMVATVVLPTPLPTRSVIAVAMPLGARAPPGRAGPPLFVQHCSFLI